MSNEKEGDEENFPGESKEWDEDSVESEDEQNSLCAILADKKRRNQDRELQTDLSPGYTTWTLRQEQRRKTRDDSGVKKTFRGSIMPFNFQDGSRAGE